MLLVLLGQLSRFLRAKESKEVRGHSRQELPCFLGLVDVALVQGTRVPGRVTQCLVELELDDEADKVPGVGEGDDMRCG